MKTVQVDIWFDFICPWCWIAKHRFDKAVMQVENEVQVRVSHHSYRLAPGMKPIDFREALTKKFASSIKVEKMLDVIATQGCEEGLTYNFNKMLFGDTRDAHTLIKHIRDEHQRQAMIEILYRESITNGRNIFDRQALLQIAECFGSSKEEIDKIDFNQLSKIELDEIEAGQISNGVPLFVFNNNTYISGAQPVEAFVLALKNMAKDVDGQEENITNTGCAENSCNI